MNICFCVDMSSFGYYNYNDTTYDDLSEIFRRCLIKNDFVKKEDDFTVIFVSKYEYYTHTDRILKDNCYLLASESEKKWAIERYENRWGKDFHINKVKFLEEEKVIAERDSFLNETVVLNRKEYNSIKDRIDNLEKKLSNLRVSY